MAKGLAERLADGKAVEDGIAGQNWTLEGAAAVVDTPESVVRPQEGGRVA